MNENHKTDEEKNITASQYDGPSRPCIYQPSCTKNFSFLINP